MAGMGIEPEAGAFVATQGGGEQARSMGEARAQQAAMSPSSSSSSSSSPSRVLISSSAAASDRELLMPCSHDPEDPKQGTPSPSGYHSGREAFYAVLQSWATKKFMSGFVILFPLAITFYITWWFVEFVDSFFRPVYVHLGINFFGLGFVTTIVFIFLVGVFVSSWTGASVLMVGEWFIKRMPLVRHIYSASKQISAAINPDQNTQAFKEVAIIRHPRIGEYAIGFITSSVVLQNESGDEELCSVYVPTNHLYIGDIFLVNSRDVIRPNLSVREGIEIVASVGMSMPQTIASLERRERLNRVSR